MVQAGHKRAKMVRFNYFEGLAFQLNQVLGYLEYLLLQ
jgi:hypothetical protein